MCLIIQNTNKNPNGKECHPPLYLYERSSKRGLPDNQASSLFWIDRQQLTTQLELTQHNRVHNWIAERWARIAKGVKRLTRRRRHPIAVQPTKRILGALIGTASSLCRKRPKRKREPGSHARGRRRYLTIDRRIPAHVDFPWVQRRLPTSGSRWPGPGGWISLVPAAR
jgi:hypothetical protein